MAQQLQLRDISVSIESPIASGLVVSNISITNRVNAAPTIRVIGHLKEFSNRQGAELELGKQASMVSSAQSGFFEPRERPESVINLRVGDESVRIVCYLARVSYSQQFGGGGGVGVQLTFLHPTVVLRSLNLSIYTVYQIHSEGTVPDEAEAARDKYNSSITSINGALTERLASIIKRLTDSPRWPGQPASVQAMKQRVHEVNKPFSNYVRNCMQASAGLDGWSMGSLSANFSSGLNRWLLESQLMQPGNFMDIIRQGLSQELLLILVTRLDDPVPRLASLSQMTATNPLEITLPIQSFSPQTGSSSMTPTTNTLMMGTAGYHFPLGENNSQPQPLRVFPEESVPGGHFHHVNAPGWLRYTAARGDGEGPLPYRNPPSGAFNLASMREKSINFMENLIGEFSDPILNRVYDRWTRIHHYHNLYGQSTASLTTDVRFNLQPGLCYNVSSLKEGDLMVGFLQSATHQVNIQQGGGTAATRLEFSHIRASTDKPGSDASPLNEASSAENGLPPSGLSF